MTVPHTATDYPDEKALIQGLRQGHEAAFRHLVRHYQARLLHIAWTITLDHEESLDIVQEVFFSVHRHIRTFRGEAGLMTWMRKITINHGLNWKRKWKRRFKWHHQPLEPDQGSPPAGGPFPADSPEADFLHHEMRREILKNVHRLPDKIRVVFMLKTVENLSCQEIAQQLNIRPATVRSRLFHARRQLAGNLEKKSQSP